MLVSPVLLMYNSSSRDSFNRPQLQPGVKSTPYGTLFRVVASRKQQQLPQPAMGRSVECHSSVHQCTRCLRTQHHLVHLLQHNTLPHTRQPEAAELKSGAAKHYTSVLQLPESSTLGASQPS